MTASRRPIPTYSIRTAQQLYDESINVHRRAGDTWGLGILLSVAAGLRLIRGDFDQARAQASEAMSLCQQALLLR